MPDAARSARHLEKTTAPERRAPGRPEPQAQPQASRGSRPQLGLAQQRAPAPTTKQPGGAEEAPAPAPASPSELAAQALRETAAPAASNPFRQHIDGVRAELRRAGLPVSADGVNVVVNDGMVEHGNSVVRAAVGDVGLGRGARTHLLMHDNEADFGERLGLNEANVGRLRSIGASTAAAEAGASSLDALGATGVHMLESTVHGHRLELGRVRELARQGTQPGEQPARPTVAVMSWGSSVQEIAAGQPPAPGEQPGGLAGEALRAPPGSPLHRELTRELGHAPRNPEDHQAVARLIARRMQSELDDPQSAATRGLNAAKEALGNELREARERDRVTLVTSMGNGHMDADLGLGDPAWASSIIHDVPGHIGVGATDLGRPDRIGDETIAPFSSGGHVEVAAPGMDIPVGGPAPDDKTRQPTPVSGTSFSAPYTAGVVALMLQANPTLSTADITRILQQTARNIPGQRDGAGVVDPVAAVRRAQELARPVMPAAAE